MAPFENADKQSVSDSSESSELREVCTTTTAGHCKAKNNMESRNSKTVEDSLETCEDGLCGSGKMKTDSQTSLQSCTCGPECGPEKCAGQEKRTLVGWDKTRSRVLYTLIGLFILWLVIYIPISLTLF